MAWRCSGATNDDLINNLVRNEVITDQRVANAMKQVDRKKYVTPADTAANLPINHPYEDSPQYIGYGATISAPHMHAMAAELLIPAFENRLGSSSSEQPIKVLDVGSGSGYFCTVMARLIGNGAQVYGIDHIQQLVDRSHKNVQADDPMLLAAAHTGNSPVIHLKCGDGREGWREAGPFDAIHVGAAAERLLPSLVDQLKPGGRMICPIGLDGGHQTLELIEKSADGTVKQKTITGVMYVPLTSEDRQLRR